MALLNFTFRLVNFTSGVGLPGATFTVYNSGTTVKANLYNASGVATANPLIADSNATVSFYVQDGALYDYLYSLGTYTSPIQTIGAEELFLASQIYPLEAALALETSQREQVDASLSIQIGSEVVNREAAVAGEASARAAEDAYLQSQITGLVAPTVYEGTWNASTNSPALVSSTGTRGNYYLVSTAGTTTLDGNSAWNVGDFVVFSGTVWQRVPAQGAPTIPFQTLAAVQAASVPATTQLIEVLAASSPGDLGGEVMRFERVSGLQCPIAAVNPNNPPYTDTAASGYEFRQVFQLLGLYPPPAAATYYLRVTFQTAAGTNAGELAAAWVGYSGGANEYDFNGSQVQLTFNGGSTTVTGINGAQIIPSDLIAFPYTPGSKPVVSSFWSGTEVALPIFETGAAQTYISSAGGSAADAGATTPSATFGQNGNQSYGISLVEMVPQNYASLTSLANSAFVRSADTFLPGGGSNATNGGWWRLTNAKVKPKMFGSLGIGTSSYDDYPAFAAALCYCVQYGAELYVNKAPGGSYYSSTTWFVDFNLTIDGDGLGIPQTYTNIINFPNGVGGIVTAMGGGGRGISISGLDLFGVGDLTWGTTYAHGLTSQAGNSFSRMNFCNFSGNGQMYLGYSSPPTADSWSDYSTADKCHSRGNGYNGILVAGYNANAMKVTNSIFDGNGQYGIRDDSAIGCQFIGCGTSYNGWAGAGPLVTYGGVVYLAVPVQYQQNYPLLSTTTPGTNNGIWYPIANAANYASLGATVPAWTSGQNYQPGGPFCVSASAAYSSFIANYVESNPIPAWGGFSYSIILGGAAGYIPFSPPVAFQQWLQGGFTSQYRIGPSGAGDNHFTMYFGTLDLSGGQLVWGVTGSESSPSGWWARVTPTVGDFTFSYGGTPAYTITGPHTAYTFNSGASVSGVFSVPILGIGSGTGGALIGIGTAPPTGGTWGQGSIWLNQAPTPGGVMAWQCTATGTPGTWYPLLSLPVQSFVIEANTATASATLTATNVCGGGPLTPIEVDLFLSGALGAAANAQLPTAASVLATLPSAIPGVTTYKLRVINSSSGAFAWTITTNTGWSLSGSMTIPQNTWRDFIVFLGVSNTATLVNVGAGTLS